MKLVFISGPYRDPRGEWYITQNIQRAMRVGREIALLGGFPVIPHGNTAHMGGTDIPDSFWLDGDIVLMQRCDAVLFMNGWRHSAGALDEHMEAGLYGLPIFYGNATGELAAWLKR